MTTWHLLLLAWAAGVPLAITAFAFAYPAYLRRRVDGQTSQRHSASRRAQRPSLRRIG